MNWLDRLRYSLFKKLKIELTNNYTGRKKDLLFDNGELFQKSIHTNVWTKVRIILIKNSYTIATDSWWVNPSNIVPLNLTNIYAMFDSLKQTHHIIINGKVYK